jgi:TRAP-type C4-dicarboxylate transport system permease small subunit
VIIAFAVVALDILRLNAVTDFMRQDVLGYLPNVFAAVLILLASVLIASVASKALVAAIRTAGSHKPDFYGKLAYYAVVFFGVLAALNQLQIADELVQTLFMGIVFAVSLGLGLAFGLGGKETAARYLEEMTKK